MAVMWVSVLLFAAACLIPTLEFEQADGSRIAWRGWKPLAWGCFGLVLGQTAWMGNLGLFAGWVFWYLGQPIAAAGSALVALVLAATSLLLFGQAIPNGRGQESLVKLRRFRPGFYLWIGSMAVLAMGGAWYGLMQPGQPPAAGG